MYNMDEMFRLLLLTKMSFKSWICLYLPQRLKVIRNGCSQALVVHACNPSYLGG
jgi:hypothetical protein